MLASQLTRKLPSFYLGRRDASSQLTPAKTKSRKPRAPASGHGPPRSSILGLGVGGGGWGCSLLSPPPPISPPIPSRPLGTSGSPGA